MTKTYEVGENREERAVLVSLFLSGHRNSLRDQEESLLELEQLADTAGLTVVGRVVQVRDKADPAWYIGKGKVEEVREALAAGGGNVAVFDQELSGAQVRNLERELDVKIIDRTQLILDIFAQRARTREGKLQVELAQLTYLLPRLSGHGKNLSRLGGGIGTRGPGETKLETDRRHIRLRIHDLKRQLEDVIRHRELHRRRRKKSGLFQFALVGYTNAGKSTLLNGLTGADTYMEDRLFATLDPTSRLLKLPGGSEVLVTDTVGFIRHLPHDLVAAFRATLEEVLEADCILHVVDSSSPARDTQMKVVSEVLAELGAHRKEQWVVFNKIDRLDPGEAELLSAEGTFIRMSAQDPDDLERLKRLMQDRLFAGSETFLLPAARGDLIALAHRIGEVQEQSAEGDSMVLKVRVNEEIYAPHRHALEPYRISGLAEGDTGRNGSMERSKSLE